MSKSRMASLADLQASATDHLRRSFLGTDAERTDHLREVARDFVAARAYFYTNTGEPDWPGRTYAYRTWVRSVMAQAGVPAEVLSSTQAAVRYHVGNVLREVLTEEQLEDLGLQKASPRERSVAKRERLSEATALLKGGAALESLEEIQDAAVVVQGILKRVNIGALDATARAEVQKALRAVCDAARSAAEEA